MANTCSVSYVIYGQDVQSLNKMYEDFEEAFQDTKGYKYWVGKLFEKAGLNPDNFDCSGWIQHLESQIDEKAGAIYLYLVMDWTYNLTDMRILISKYSTELDIVMLAEEPGCGIFVNTDPDGGYFPEKYYMDYDFYTEDEVFAGNEYFESFEDLTKYVSDEVFKCNNIFKSVKDIKNYWEHSKENGYKGCFEIHEFEYLNI